MKVQEVVQFANNNEGEWIIDPDSDTAVEENPNAEVEWTTYNTTTDEFDIELYFIDSRNNESEFLGIISGSLTCIFLDEFGIEYPDTY